MTVDLVLLVLLLGIFGLNTWLNVGRFKAFKAGRIARATFYRYGLLKSFLIFFGGAVVSLMALNRFDALIHMPDELLSVALPLRASLSDVPSTLIYGVISAWVGVLCLGSLMGGRQLVRLQGAPDTGRPALGTLLPRNGSERAWGTAIALNAGLSEELFFRLVLPLLMIDVTGLPGLGFGLALLAFGLGHAYQGIWGIVATTIAGAMLGFVYLYSGQIWLAAALHAAIDLWSLAVVPLLIGWSKHHAAVPEGSEA